VENPLFFKGAGPSAGEPSRQPVGGGGKTPAGSPQLYPKKKPSCAQNGQKGALLHRFSTALVGRSNPSPKAEEGLSKQRNLPAKLSVVAHLTLDLGAPVDDG
jgi:hypothetical protein